MGERTERTETYRASLNLMTPHDPGAYPPDLLVVKLPGEDWRVSYVVPNDGQSFEAKGGEVCYAYETVDGGKADGFELRRGDRATRVRSDLPFFLGEWQVVRAGDWNV